MGDIKIKVYSIDPAKEEAKVRWRSVIIALEEGIMGKKEYRVTGVGHSFYPSPLYLEFRTSIKSAHPDAKELGAKIEKEVEEFLNSEEVREKIKDDPYRIVVLSKDKKKIN